MLWTNFLCGFCGFAGMRPGVERHWQYNYNVKWKTMWVIGFRTSWARRRIVKELALIMRAHTRLLAYAQRRKYGLSHVIRKFSCSLFSLLARDSIVYNKRTLTWSNTKHILSTPHERASGVCVWGAMCWCRWGWFSQRVGLSCRNDTHTRNESRALRKHISTHVNTSQPLQITRTHSRCTELCIEMFKFNDDAASF